MTHSTKMLQHDTASDASTLWLHLRSFILTPWYVLTGRFHFRKAHHNEVIDDENGRSYTLFRELEIEPASKRRAAPAKAVFTIRFRVERLSPRQNRLFSLLAIPLYAGLPGFRTKIFTINGCDCRSIYTWDTVEDAERYARSYAIRFMTARSVPGSVAWMIQEVG